MISRNRLRKLLAAMIVCTVRGQDNTARNDNENNLSEAGDTGAVNVRDEFLFPEFSQRDIGKALKSLDQVVICDEDVLPLKDSVLPYAEVDALPLVSDPRGDPSLVRRGGDQGVPLEPDDGDARRRCSLRNDTTIDEAGGRRGGITQNLQQRMSPPDNNGYLGDDAQLGNELGDRLDPVRTQQKRNLGSGFPKGGNPAGGGMYPTDYYPRPGGYPGGDSSSGLDEGDEAVMDDVMDGSDLVVAPRRVDDVGVEGEVTVLREQPVHARSKGSQGLYAKDISPVSDDQRNSIKLETRADVIRR